VPSLTIMYCGGVFPPFQSNSFLSGLVFSMFLVGRIALFSAPREHTVNGKERKG